MEDLFRRPPRRFAEVEQSLMDIFGAAYGTGPTSGRFRAIWLTPDKATADVMDLLVDAGLVAYGSQEQDA